jgi:thiol-disulfide isomerase/thioredoxin
MRKGNTAPDIQFPQAVYPSATFQPKKLSDYDSPYTLVVFGASWCPSCAEDVPQIAKYYPKWKSEGMDVLFVSLDKSEMELISFTARFPFVSICDYMVWDSPIVRNYHVFGTPTMFLLDNSRTIILRPTSIKQVDAWVDWYLAQGNPLPELR